jgi:hypothetical protein
MKLGITLIILGSLGVLQYIYFQCTPLALNYGGVVTEKIGGVDVVTEIIWTRDWSVGIVGALIGAVILFFGVYRLMKTKKAER